MRVYDNARPAGEFVPVPKGDPDVEALILDQAQAYQAAQQRRGPQEAYCVGDVSNTSLDPLLQAGGYGTAVVLSYYAPVRLLGGHIA